jgi:hypothetical protein
MNYKIKAMRNFMLSAATVLAVMFASQDGKAQCVSSELKEQWRAGNYQQVVRPLMDCYDSQSRGVGEVEFEYMLAKTWCNLPRQKQNGCSTFSTLKSEHGRYIQLDGIRIDLDREACCQLPEYRAATPGVIEQFMRVPFRVIVNDARAELGNEAVVVSPPPVSADEGSSQITSRLSGRCLDILYGSVENTALLVQYDCHRQNNQTWRLVRRDDGYYNIVAKHSGRCLDVNGSSLDNGVEIFQYDCHDGDNQRWQVARSDDGYSIINKHSGKCLDVYSGNTENLAHIVQWDCHGGANQKWAIERLGTGTTVGPPRGMRDGSVAPAPGSIMVAPPPPRRTVVAPPPVRVPPPPL